MYDLENKAKFLYLTLEFYLMGFKVMQQESNPGIVSSSYYSQQLISRGTHKGSV